MCSKRSIPHSNRRKLLAGETLGTEWVSDYPNCAKIAPCSLSDLLYPGRYTLRYLARVICAGDAIAPSAKIEEMYHPERFGTTETMHVRRESLQ